MGRLPIIGQSKEHWWANLSLKEKYAYAIKECKASKNQIDTMGRIFDQNHRMLLSALSVETCLNEEGAGAQDMADEYAAMVKTVEELVWKLKWWYLRPIWFLMKWFGQKKEVRTAKQMAWDVLRAADVPDDLVDEKTFAGADHDENLQH